MSRFAVLLICICLANSVFADQDRQKTVDEIRIAFSDVDNGPVLVVAHRGCWSAAPENSVASIEACVELGVDAVEIDVRLTKHRGLVIFHDSTLHRMTEQWGYVSEWNLDDLRALQLFERDGSSSSINGKRLLTRHRLATLEEILTAAKGKLLINLEIKWNSTFGFQETFDAATELAVSMGVEDHIFWKIPPSGWGSGQDVPADTKFEGLNAAKLPFVMPTLAETARSFEQQIDDFTGADVIGFEVLASNIDHWPLVNERLYGAKEYRFMGIAVLPQWSAGLSDELALRDPEAAWGKQLELGIDMIMTDRPEQLLRFLRQRHTE